MKILDAQTVMENSVLTKMTFDRMKFFLKTTIEGQSNSVVLGAMFYGANLFTCPVTSTISIAVLYHADNEIPWKSFLKTMDEFANEFCVTLQVLDIPCHSESLGISVNPVEGRVDYHQLFVIAEACKNALPFLNPLYFVNLVQRSPTKQELFFAYRKHLKDSERRISQLVRQEGVVVDIVFEVLRRHLVTFNQANASIQRSEIARICFLRTTAKLPESVYKHLEIFLEMVYGYQVEFEIFYSHCLTMKQEGEEKYSFSRDKILLDTIERYKKKLEQLRTVTPLSLSILKELIITERVV